jgi:hypothetical protein
MFESVESVESVDVFLYIIELKTHTILILL